MQSLGVGCCHSIVVIVGWNPAEGMDARLLCLLYVVEAATSETG